MWSSARPAFSPPSIDLSSLDGSNGFKLSGVADERLPGGSVSAAGDVNGDGFADLIVGADSADEGAHRGAAYVVFGSPVADRFPRIARRRLSRRRRRPRDGEVSKGALCRGDFTFSSGGSLEKLDLSAASFAGADMTISAKTPKTAPATES